MSATHALCVAFAAEDPGAVARLGETSGVEPFAELVGTLPAETAAGVLTATVPVQAAEVIARLTSPQVADVMSALAPGPASAVLRRLPERQRDGLMAELPPATAEPIRRLLRYTPDQAGSRLDPRAPAVAGSATPEEALSSVRGQATGALHYVYVISSDSKLVGVINLRELMLAPPEATVASIMVKDPMRLRATDRLQAIVHHRAWQHVHALPVVDSEDLFLGAIRYSAFRTMQVELGRANSAPDPAAAASALAELFWLGTGAMGRLAEAAFSSVSRPPEASRGN